MKVTNWPETDRRLWYAALAPTDPFAEAGGSRAGHRAISNRNIAKGYGRWLTFLSRRGALDGSDHPADRITPALVVEYVRELDCLCNMSSTILARLEELGEMAKVLDPQRDWSHINRLAGKVRACGNPPSRKHGHLVASDELLASGDELMRRAASQGTQLGAATMFRDGLLIALLALRPLRLRNLAELTLGTDLRRTETGWWIVLPSAATKTHAALELPWPDQLTADLEEYVDLHRPTLLAQRGRSYEPGGSRLWISTDGSPLTSGGIYPRIVKATREAFGRPVNPHLFRDALATTIAINDPARVRIAVPILGHTTFSTTERYYNLARSLEAHREFVQQIESLRGSRPFTDNRPR